MAPTIMTGISIATAVAPLVGDLLVWLEGHFGKGTGPVKLQTGASMLLPGLAALGTAGVLGETPTVEAVTAALQKFVDAEKTPGGLLSASPTATGAATSLIPVLPPGIGMIIAGVGQLVTSIENKAATK